MDMIFRALPFLQGHLLPQQTTSIAPFPQHQPLPSNPYPQDSNSEAHAAYDECLKCQDEAGNDAKLLIYARCLGFLIIEAPDDVARDYISHEIMRCEGNGDQMNALAQFYITHLFRLFRNDKGHTPTPSFHPSRPSFEDESFFFSSTVDPALTDHRTSKWAALEHDNFCCMVTGHVEMAYYRGLSNDDRITRHPNSIMTRTHFCHIFPSTSQNLDHDDPKTHYAGNVRGIVFNYGRINVLDELGGLDCHRLSNKLTGYTTSLTDCACGLRGFRTCHTPTEFAPYFRVAMLWSRSHILAL